MGTDARPDQAAEPKTDAFEKKLLANAEIARLIDNSGTASTDGYDLVRNMWHALTIRGPELAPHTQRKPPALFPSPLPSFPTFAPSSTFRFANVDDPTRNKRPRKRDPETTRHPDYSDKDSCQEHNPQH